MYTKPKQASLGQSRDVNSILQLKRTIGNQAVLRLLQNDVEEHETGSDTAASIRFAHDFSQIPVHSKARTDVIHQIAQNGTAGNFGPLPHLDRIQQSFGARHNLSRVRAHVGSQASVEATKLMGAEAYATGDRVVFGSPPSLRVAAHEAAHIVQQLHGVKLQGGVGQVGDVHEKEADAVADLVVRGERVADSLFAPLSGNSTTSWTQHQSVQMYTNIIGQPYNKLADDGKLAVKDHTRDAWAESSNITKSNNTLAGIDTMAKIEELSSGDITVTPPSGSGSITLKKFRMVNRASGAEAELTDDCGTACQEMLGANTAGYKSFVARNLRGTTKEFTKSSPYQADDNAPGGLVSTTERLSGEIYIRIFKREFKKSLSRVNAVKEWDKLSAAKKDQLSKKYGINKYAVPKVGQGITIGSERDMPGGDVAATGGGTGYNFHFGLNLLSSGHDYITLEDYASSGVKYYFDMFGPQSKGQSWADASSNVNALGAKTTTMVVQHPESLKGIVNTDNIFFEADPGKPKYNKRLAKNTKVAIIRKGHSWMKVKVMSGSSVGESGWILNKFFTDN